MFRVGLGNASFVAYGIHHPFSHLARHPMRSFVSRAERWNLALDRMSLSWTERMVKVNLRPASTKKCLIEKVCICCVMPRKSVSQRLAKSISLTDNRDLEKERPGVSRTSR